MPSSNQVYTISIISNNVEVASLVVGGTMFMVGAYTHALLNPLPRTTPPPHPLPNPVSP